MEIIQHAETVPLSDKELRYMLGEDKGRVKVILYNSLKSYSSLEQLLPKANTAVIILLSIEAPHAPPVGHWITILNHGDHYEHFDSYGIGPDEELAITHEKPYMTHMISNTTKSVEHSQTKLQQKRESVNTCGRWCVARARFPHLNRTEFVKFIREVHPIPDVAVTLLTYLLHPI